MGQTRVEREATRIENVPDFQRRKKWQRELRVYQLAFETATILINLNQLTFCHAEYYDFVKAICRASGW
ncbi:MAG: hypothetical protein ABI621_06185, partial [Chloroflexota bacterium]